MTNTPTLYQELREQLSKSDAQQRKAWVAHILAEDVALSSLLPLATEPKEVASRFLWLLGDLAETQPERLFKALPKLYSMKSEINGIDVNRSFAKFWQYCGIPEVNESKAIELLFCWLGDAQSKVSLKMHSALALYKVSERFPEIQVELHAQLEEQLLRNDNSFNTRAQKLLDNMKKP